MTYVKPGGQPTVTTEDPVEDGYKTYEDSSFGAGDSPVEHDFETDLGRSSYEGYIACDGAGDITIAMDVNEASGYGDEVTLKEGERFSLGARRVRKLRVTHTGTDSAYRIFAG